MQLVLFDIDGTLLNVDGAGKRAMQEAIARRYGIPQALLEIALDGKTDQSILREALGRAGADFPGLEPAFLEIYLPLLEEELSANGHFSVLQGVPDLLSRLQADEGFLMGLATGNVEEGAWLKISRVGLEPYFSFGGFGSDAEDRTEVIRHAIERGRRVAHPRVVEQTVVIGDTPRDILHGRRAGARTMAVATGSYSQSELARHHPDYCLADLSPAPEVHQLLRRL